MPNATESIADKAAAQAVDLDTRLAQAQDPTLRATLQRAIRYNALLCEGLRILGRTAQPPTVHS